MARILIIDDDGIARDALAVFLSREGHEVLTAADGANGLVTFRNTLPEMVLLDRGLPAAPALAVLGKIREISMSVPVIVMTGGDAPEDAAECVAAGATAAVSRADGLEALLSAADRLVCRPRHERPPAHGAAPAAVPGEKRERALILVADDDAAILRLLSRYLAESGYSVITAADGLEAERLAHEDRPDIILLDIFMPGKDGVVLLRQLTEEMPATGIMMITGNADEELARSCLRIGAFDYASKPLNLDCLGRAIEARLLLQRERP